MFFRENEQGVTNCVQTFSKSHQVDVKMITVAYSTVDLHCQIYI